jgi:hypothetical protein
MLFRINLRRKLSAQMSRFTPTQTSSSPFEKDKQIRQPELYESIAMGNALAEIEDNANRQWGRQ